MAGILKEVPYILSVKKLVNYVCVSWKKSPTSAILREAILQSPFLLFPNLSMPMQCPENSLNII